MKRVALVLNGKAESGGEFQYECMLINAVVRYLSDQYDFVFFSRTKECQRYLRQQGIKSTLCSIPNFRHMPYKLLYIAGVVFPGCFALLNRFSDFGKIMIQNKIDVIVFLTQDIFPVWGIKSVSHEFDLMHRYENRFKEVSEDYAVRELLYNSMRAMADVVITDSKVGRQQFIESYCIGHRKVPHVVSLPFITTMYAKENATVTDDEIRSLPSRFIFYPAQFWQHKNHENLVKALAIVREKIPDIHLVLVGSEKNNKKRVDDLIKKCDLTRNVDIVGFVSDGMIRYMYENAVAMIMPSFFGPTNIPPLEAMSYGCPVAVSNNYAMPEQVGNAGLTFDPEKPEEIADCIYKLWTDEDLRQTLSERGKKRIQSYGEKEFAQRFGKIIQALYGRKKG